jgi:type IV secretory pathway VirB2 component (pilin)
MSEWFAEGSGGFRPAFPLIAFGIGFSPYWIRGLVHFLSPKRSAAQRSVRSPSVPPLTQYARSMGKQIAVVIYVLALVVVVVGVDVLFLRHHTLLRLIVNIGIVVVFAASYLLLRRVLQRK